MNSTSLADDAYLALSNLSDFAGGIVSPTVRLGVTGLARAGKTVFITSMVHALLNGGNLPMFLPAAQGRLARVRLEPQPSMDVPRFEYEAHLKMILEDRMWPQSTRQISELRLTCAFEPEGFLSRIFKPARLNIDIVDYPGEWLLDLPLLNKSYEEWSQEALKLSHDKTRQSAAAMWHQMLTGFDPKAERQEANARQLAGAFTQYLHACRQDANALATVPPGRFLMPGDLEGSAALTFCPLPVERWQKPEANSLHALMAERYEGYKRVVVKPFFRDHFARLDRQIVLVDVLQSANGGRDALGDLGNALSDILSCFRPGDANWLSSIFTRRIDRILFAATKADHLHHGNHDRLENLLQAMVEERMRAAQFAGAAVKVAALASLRATREAEAKSGADTLPVIIGTPIEGEMIDGKRFDGGRETAIFPGDLPENPETLIAADVNKDANAGPMLQFVRFRPPLLTKKQANVALPHIRLDRAMQFLLGDKFA